MTLTSRKIASEAPILFEVGIPNLICQYVHFEVAECEVLFPGAYNLDLWSQF